MKSTGPIGLAGDRHSYHNDIAMTFRLTMLFAFFVALAAVGLGGAATAQEEWPTRPVLVVSPFTAGSANDIVARLIFDQVGQQLSQACRLLPKPAIRTPNICSGAAYRRRPRSRRPLSPSSIARSTPR